MCQLDWDAGETCEAWSERLVKARKAHRCNCCGGAIASGEVYERHFHTFEGHVASEKTCSACIPMRKAFAEAHGTSGVPGYMRTLLHECINAEEEEGHNDVVEGWREELRAMDARKARRT